MRYINLKSLFMLVLMNKRLNTIIMNKYILSIISIISLPFLAQEKTDLLLPELGDRVSGAVSSSQEKMIGKNF